MTSDSGRAGSRRTVANAWWIERTEAARGIEGIVGRRRTRIRVENGIRMDLH